LCALSHAWAVELGEPPLEFGDALGRGDRLVAERRRLTCLREIEQDQDREPDDRREAGVGPDGRHEVMD
jgi:hypothetical protein